MNPPITSIKKAIYRYKFNVSLRKIVANIKTNIATNLNRGITLETSSKLNVLR